MYQKRMKRENRSGGGEKEIYCSQERFVIGNPSWGWIRARRNINGARLNEGENNTQCLGNLNENKLHVKSLCSLFFVVLMDASLPLRALAHLLSPGERLQHKLAL